MSSAFRSKWFSIEALPGPVTKQHLLRADARQLLDDVLHDRLAADRQHLLRLGLGGRQQARAETGDGDDGDFNIHGSAGTMPPAAGCGRAPAFCQPPRWTRCVRIIELREPSEPSAGFGDWTGGRHDAHRRTQSGTGRRAGGARIDGSAWRRGRRLPTQAFSAAADKAAIVSVMTAVADWQLAHPSKHEPYDWTQAAFYTGMMAFAGITDNPKYVDAMKAMGERNQWRPGPAPRSRRRLRRRRDLRAAVPAGEEQGDAGPGAGPVQLPAHAAVRRPARLGQRHRERASWRGATRSSWGRPRWPR